MRRIRIRWWLGRSARAFGITEFQIVCDHSQDIKLDRKATNAVVLGPVLEAAAVRWLATGEGNLTQEMARNWRP